MKPLAELYKFPFRAMASSCEVQLYAADYAAGKLLADLIIAEVARIEAKYSRYSADSVLSLVNACAGSGKSVEVDAETATLLDYAYVAFEQSAGLFDISSGVLRRAWDFKTGKLPSESQVAELLPLVGLKRVVWQKPFVTLPTAGMQLDFGGFGKEYAVDRAVGVALESQALAGLVNLGGDVRVFGARPTGAAWSIGIAHPRRAAAVTAYLPVSSGALATSGDYERYMQVDGRRYCHILNPVTGWPIEGKPRDGGGASSLQSVSVYADSCLIAGTLATIAMLMGEKRGERFLCDLQVGAMLINQRGEAIAHGAKTAPRASTGSTAG